MSTGYSGNLGFSMPDDWAFDQFAEISIGDFAIDKVATTSARETAVKQFNISNSAGSSDDLAKINSIIQSLADDNGIFQFVKSVSVKAFGETYTVETPLVDLSVKVDVGSSISTDSGETSVSYNVSNGDVSFSIDDPIKNLLTENAAALGADQITSEIQKVAGTIKNGSITTDESISTTGMSLTLKLKSTFEHEDSDGETYEMDYEITLTVSFHNLTGTLPVSVTNAAYAEYETDQKKITANPDPIYEFAKSHPAITAVIVIAMICAPEGDIAVAATSTVGMVYKIIFA